MTKLARYTSNTPQLFARKPPLTVLPLHRLALLLLEKPPLHNSFPALVGIPFPPQIFGAAEKLSYAKMVCFLQCLSFLSRAIIAFILLCKTGHSSFRIPFPYSTVLVMHLGEGGCRELTNRSNLSTMESGISKMVKCT